ncbi:MAG TPA: hypothetical protein V6C72_09965 [Chroococcales cyanobacterium]
MRRYLTLAGTGFASCACLSCLFLSVVTVVPWGYFLLYLMGAYFTFSGAYIATFQAVFRDILFRQHIWAKPRIRTLGVPLVGASAGLVYLGWAAIFKSGGMAELNTNAFTQLLCGAGPESIRRQARQLMPQAEMLAICQMLLDNALQYAAASACLAMFCVWLYDSRLLRRKMNSSQNSAGPS